MVRQIVDYVEQNRIYKTSMSGFRKNHSTETLLMKIRNDIVSSMNKGEITLATFLDYSKAFDTVDFKTLLMKLRKIGFSNDATTLLLSYPTQQNQFVKVDDKMSKQNTVVFGVPQGSMLGSFFSTCTQSIFKIILLMWKQINMQMILQYMNIVSQMNFKTLWTIYRFTLISWSNGQKITILLLMIQKLKWWYFRQPH